jgi:general secretion pathway protein F
VIHGTAYKYRAVRTDGVVELGVVEASSQEAAGGVLIDRGLFPVELKLQSALEERASRLSSQDLAVGLRILADLLDAGIPMSKALDVFADLVPAAWRPALPVIQSAVREGAGLGSALASAPVEIPGVVTGILRAGEAGSGLAAAVRRAAEITESSAATSAALRGALAYPIILVVTGTVSLGLLVTVVLPRFADVLIDSGQPLPATTALVLAAARAVRVLALPALAASFATVLFLRTWSASGSGQEKWHEFLLRIPVLGAVRRSAATSRVTASLAALLECGVPMAAALLHGARAGGDSAIAVRLARAREAVLAGQRVGTSLEAESALTATAVQLAKAGEETGRLSEMLAHASRIEAAQADRITRSTVRLIEPALILVFGAIIALVAAALLQAVYGVRVGP